MTPWERTGETAVELACSLRQEALPLAESQLCPSPVGNHNRNSFQGVLSPASELSAPKMVLTTPKLATGIRGRGAGLMNCAPSDFVGSLSSVAGSFILLDYVPLFLLV